MVKKDMAKRLAQNNIKAERQTTSKIRTRVGIKASTYDRRVLIFYRFQSCFPKSRYFISLSNPFLYSEKYNNFILDLQA